LAVSVEGDLELNSTSLQENSSAPSAGSTATAN
jgi:hypothetical protein